MNTYEKNLILALEEINKDEYAGYGHRFANTSELLDSMGDYALYENCHCMAEVVADRWKSEWGFTLPEELEDYFDMDRYIEAFQLGSGEWFETGYGMVERLI